MGLTEPLDAGRQVNKPRLGTSGDLEATIQAEFLTNWRDGESVAVRRKVAIVRV
jgi:hypothetical protein